MTLKLKDGELEVYTSCKELWYALTQGYLKAEEYLDDKLAKKVQNAIAVIEEFVDLLEENELFEEC